MCGLKGALFQVTTTAPQSGRTCPLTLILCVKLQKTQHHGTRRQHRDTHGSEDASDLLQDRLDVPDRAEDQGADDNVHRLVFHFRHVVSGHHHEVAVGQMRVCVHAEPQIPVEVRVGVGADHSASMGVKLEVSPAPTADLQQAKIPVRLCEFGHVSEKLPLGFVHFVIVGECDVVGERGKQTLVHTCDPHQG